jgi:mono/diheme cytochrome c family protein
MLLVHRRRDDMRVFAIISLIFVLALAWFLVEQLGLTFSLRAKAGHGNGVRQERQEIVHGVEVPREQAKSNPPAGVAEGFYVGTGKQRVYVNYATTDPVLRSLIQSAMDSSSDPTAKGKEIFLRICAACHQRDGEGKDGVAPPLVGAEWVLAPGGDGLVRIVLNGLKGPVRVRGRDWDLSMPPWRANLDDDQLAVVLTYVRSHLGSNHAEAISPELVAAARQNARETPETSDELLRVSNR